ncbi:uncharacterized protein LOC118434462 [Folsomia candida]|uniref:F-box domain-containing protein n=1 Tax=Folsomia candida TaxID=158441 RepID=A0A226ET38_FOLCA|nr:uncharacterized protein LOC118434462 [Folsomia candida]OXA60773.1 hypothetical protein Fcan01_04783 [Folsomia candida]
MDKLSLNESISSNLPLQIPLILSKIFDYLSPSSDLKNVRLVSKFWNYEAIPLLLKKSKLKLDFTDYSICRKNSRLTSISKINSFKNFFHPNVEIKLLRFHDRYIPNLERLDDIITSDGESIFDVEEEMKSMFGQDANLPCKPAAPELFPIQTGSRIAFIWHDINLFLCPQYDNHLKKLTLFGPFNYSSTFALFMNVLIKVSTSQPGLEELEIKISLGSDFIRKFQPRGNISTPPDMKMSFPALHTLTVTINYEKDTEQATSTFMREWIPPFVLGMKNLKCLNLNGGQRVDQLFMEEVKNEWLNLSKLDSLTLHHPSLPCYCLVLSMPLGFKLRKLELHTNTSIEQEIVLNNGIDELLKKHLTRLEVLVLRLHRPKKHARIRLPPLPRLKKLSIGLVGEYMAYRRGSIGNLVAVSRIGIGGGLADQQNREPMPTFTFVFHSENGIENGINYETHFPSLVSLTVWTQNLRGGKEVQDWEEDKWFFQSFVPLDTPGALQGRETVCKSLRYLHIPHIKGEKVGKMFPNVHEPWLNEARKESK